MASWPIVAALQRCRDELPGRRHSVQSGHMVATEARRGARAQVPRPAPVVRETLCGQPSNPIPLPPLQPSAPPHPHPEARDLRAAVGATTRRVRVAAIRAAQCMLAAGLETSARPCMQPSACRQRGSKPLRGHACSPAHVGSGARNLCAAMPPPLDDAPHNTPHAPHTDAYSSTPRCANVARVRQPSCPGWGCGQGKGARQVPASKPVRCCISTRARAKHISPAPFTLVWLGLGAAGPRSFALGAPRHLDLFFLCFRVLVSYLLVHLDAVLALKLH